MKLLISVGIESTVRDTVPEGDWIGDLGDSKATPMAKVKIIPAGDGWSIVVPNVRGRYETARATHYYHRRKFHETNRYNSFQGRRYVSQTQTQPHKLNWRGETGFSKNFSKAPKHNSHQRTLGNTNWVPLIHTALNALISYPIANNGLSKPPSNQNTYSQYRIIHTTTNPLHLPPSTINSPNQPTVMATVQTSPTKSPNYTPSDDPHNSKNNLLGPNRSATPIPYIKYPKPPATLNLNIQHEPSYAQTLTSPTQPPHTDRFSPNHTLHSHQHVHAAPSPPPPRYQLPPWINFVDQNPWSAHTTPAQPSKPQRLPLPLPPMPTHQAWRGRCFNCLEFGHDQTECKDKERTCAFCWAKGHEARSCPEYNKIHFDPMRPLGNQGEAGLPTNRPDTATVYILETHQMRYNAMELRRAIIIDARLKTMHNPQVIQSVLMAVSKSTFPF